MAGNYDQNNPYYGYDSARSSNSSGSGNAYGTGRSRQGGASSGSGERVSLRGSGDTAQQSTQERSRSGKRSSSGTRSSSGSRSGSSGNRRPSSGSSGGRRRKKKVTWQRKLKRNVRRIVRMLSRLPQEMLILLAAGVVIVIIIIVLIVRALLPSGNKNTSQAESSVTVSTEESSDASADSTDTSGSSDTADTTQTSEEGTTDADGADTTEVSTADLLSGLDNYSLIADDTETEALIALMTSVTPSSCSASSTLVTSSGTSYGTDNLFDDDLTTSWQEGEDDEGIGVTITSTFASGTEISAIVFWSGNETTSDKFSNNNRPAGITISVSSDSQSYSTTYTLEDYMGGQAIVFDTAIPVESVVIRIDSVYEGAVYNDTVISELAFLTE